MMKPFPEDVGVDNRCWIHPALPFTNPVQNLPDQLHPKDKVYNVCQSNTAQGCILNCKWIFLSPPFLIYIFSPNEIYYNEGVRAAVENILAFFLQFCIFKSIGEKIWILFANWGKNMHSPPPFSSPFNHFFPHMLFGHIFFI